MCFSIICLLWQSLASAEPVQHVVLLTGQALLDGRCDHPVTHAGLPTLFCMLLAQPDLGIVCLHSFKRLAMSVAVALMQNAVYSGLTQALQCMQQRKQ